VIFIDGPISLVEGRFDAALTSDFYPHPGSVVTRSFARTPNWLVASPRYLASVGKVRDVTDLGQVVMLSYEDGATTAEHDPARRWLDANAAQATHLHANSSDMVRRMALEGMGVALLPAALVAADVRAGALTLVLPEEDLPSTGLAIAYGSRRNLAPSVRALVDFLAEQSSSDETLAAPRARDTHRQARDQIEDVASA
jgi:DNA-binding transcriptional LysR family regulator